MHKLYQEIASLLIARANCSATIEQYRIEVTNPNKEAKYAVPRESAVNYYNNASDWFERHTDRIKALIREFMPSGSGWDTGTKIDFDCSHGNKLVFYGSFHHMNDVGMYDGWTDHQIIVTPSLAYALNIRVTGRDRNQIKDYLGEMFEIALNTRTQRI